MVGTKLRNMKWSGVNSIFGWIKNDLRETGIDTENFKGHSTRSASTSNAGLPGLSVKDILERGSWSML